MAEEEEIKIALEDLKQLGFDQAPGETASEKIAYLLEQKMKDDPGGSVTKEEIEVQLSQLRWELKDLDEKLFESEAKASLSSG